MHSSGREQASSLGRIGIWRRAGSCCIKLQPIIRCACCSYPPATAERASESEPLEFVVRSLQSPTRLDIPRIGTTCDGSCVFHISRLSKLYEKGTPKAF